MLCAICGRRLRSEKSRQLGYGPVCFKNTFGAVPRIRAGDSKDKTSTDDEEYDIPGQMSIEDFLGTDEK